MNRRQFAGTVTAAASAAMAYAADEAAPGRAALRCSSDGMFRVLSISDMHYGPDIDSYGIALTEKLIEVERPGLVVVNGDCLSGGASKNEAELRKSIGHVAAAMENKRVPWAVTFGNHDQEHQPATGIDKHGVLAMYSAFPYNVNGGYTKGLYGAGDKHILIWDAAGSKPVYCVWLIDSNDYFKDAKGNQSYDWIHGNQIQHYLQTSIDLEKQHERKIPGLMFFHIPLREFGEMVHAAKVIGVRQEHESPSPVNSGMFAALLERGDVRGVYCGHDHVNNYMGRWRGIELGYDGSIGHYTYPRLAPEDPAQMHVRGGRVFEIAAATGQHRTWMRFKSGAKNWESESEALTRDHVK